MIECFCGHSSGCELSTYLFSLMKAIGSHCDQESVACSLDGEIMPIRLVPAGGAAAEADRLLLRQLINN